MDLCAELVGSDSAPFDGFLTRHDYYWHDIRSCMDLEVDEVLRWLPTKHSVLPKVISGEVYM